MIKKKLTLERQLLFVCCLVFYFTMSLRTMRLPLFWNTT